MTKITDIYIDTTCKKFETALSRFLKKYEGHEEWKEVFEWMNENEIDFYSDKDENGRNWSYALHLDTFETGHYYIALIERR